MGAVFRGKRGNDAADFCGHFAPAEAVGEELWQLGGGEVFRTADLLAGELEIMWPLRGRDERD